MDVNDVPVIIWTGYLKYRAKLRGFELSNIEHTLRYSTEKYFDIATQRSVAIGKHDDIIVIIPYVKNGSEITPITVHATSRRQINFRLKTGRFING